MAGEFGYVTSLLGLVALIFAWDSLEILRTRRAELVQAVGGKVLTGLALGLMVFGAVGMLVSVVFAATGNGEMLLRLSHGLLDVALWQVVLLHLMILALFIRMKWKPLPGPFVALLGAIPFAIHLLSFESFGSIMDGTNWIVPLLGALATLIVCYAILRPAWERLRGKGPAAADAPEGAQG